MAPVAPPSWAPLFILEDTFCLAGCGIVRLSGLGCGDCVSGLDFLEICLKI